jgi:hypothetical protein
MDIEADVSIPAGDPLPSVEAHPHANLGACRPRRRGEGALRVDRCSDGGHSVLKDEKKRIACGARVHSVVGRHGVTDQLVVAFEDVAEGPRPNLRDERRGALDVREQERDGPHGQIALQLAHVG